MSTRPFDFGVTIPSFFDTLINGTTHGRQVPRHPTMDEADEYDAASDSRGRYSGRTYFLLISDEPPIGVELEMERRRQNEVVRQAERQGSALATPLSIIPAGWRPG